MLRTLEARESLRINSMVHSAPVLLPTTSTSGFGLLRRQRLQHFLLSSLGVLNSADVLLDGLDSLSTVIRVLSYIQYLFFLHF